MLHQLSQLIKSIQNKIFKMNAFDLKHVSNPMGMLGSYN